MNSTLYLLTGATGLLGWNILRQLLAQGRRVRVLALPNDPAIADIPQGVEVIESGLLDDAGLDRFFSVSDNSGLIVIHAAGIISMDPNPNEKVYAVNVGGAGKIVDRCVRHKVKKLVYVSSISAIPELPIGQIIREAYAHDPDRVIGYYAKTKAMATDLVVQAARKFDLDTSVVYPSGIIGPNDYGGGMVTTAIKWMASGKLRISIGGTFNYVDVRDLAAAVIACSEKGRKGETYIISSRCYTFTEFLRTICKEAGVKMPLFTVPLWIVRPVSYFGNVYIRITKRPAWFSRFTIYNLERNNNYSCEKAETELGFKCRSLNETVADTIQWLRQVGKIK